MPVRILMSTSSSVFEFDDSLDDEMVVTVIATGFELDKNFDIPDYRFTAASAEEPKQTAEE